MPQMDVNRRLPGEATWPPTYVDVPTGFSSSAEADGRTLQILWAAYEPRKDAVPGHSRSCGNGGGSENGSLRPEDRDSRRHHSACRNAWYPRTASLRPDSAASFGSLDHRINGRLDILRQ
jgi:hypothetical protein